MRFFGRFMQLALRFMQAELPFMHCLADVVVTNEVTAQVELSSKRF